MSNSSTDIQNLPLCDIVMEGGVTSGVIYPSAVAELSQKFRIKNIGGTSAGAIAAAATAAAELGRLNDPDNNPGFKRLETLTAELSETDTKKMSRLLKLFQPQEETSPLFQILISALNKKTKSKLFLGLIEGILKAFFLRILIIFMIIFAVAFYFYNEISPENVFSWIALLITALSITTLTVVVSIWRLLTGPLVKNGYGICKGYQKDADKLSDGDKNEPLTLWLSRLLNKCAGRGSDEPPLTFGNLWKGTECGKVVPPDWLQEAGLKSWKRYVDLQMVTTNITHSRPYCFPLKDSDDDEKLYFKEQDLMEYFPSNIVKHMIEKSPKKEQIDNEIYYKLPLSSEIPVVFATRLSLSFPFLLSAVPLYAWDYENPDKNDRKLERCWFSDGGISSNFPIHLFDTPLPIWPTFGIKLENEQIHRLIHKEESNTNHEAMENDENRFFFPTSNEKGRGDNWIRFDSERGGTKKLVGFIFGLFDSARNWHDHTLTRSPGVRDRIVRIYLTKNEGGLNLNMDDELIKGLSKCGRKAATMLTDRFSPSSEDPMNFNNHRWVRLRKLAYVLEKDFSSIQRSLQADSNNHMNWHSLVNSNFVEDKNRYPIFDDRREKLNKLLVDLENISHSAVTGPSMQDEDSPKRGTTIRIVPDI